MNNFKKQKSRSYAQWNSLSFYVCIEVPNNTPHFLVGLYVWANELQKYLKIDLLDHQYLLSKIDHWLNIFQCHDTSGYKPMTIQLYMFPMNGTKRNIQRSEMIFFFSKNNLDNIIDHQCRYLILKLFIHFIYM